MNKLTILNFDEVDSTNSLAFQLVREGKAFDGFMLVAKSQSKGRGRCDRQWDSPEGNLYFSLILQSDKFSAVTDYSFLIACVIGKVLNSFGFCIQYKWPNDIILEGKKLAGILLQFERIKGIDNLVIGVGVNLVSCPDYAVSLENAVGKENFLKKFEEVFLEYKLRYEQFGFRSIRQEWKNNAFKIGSDVKLSNGMEGVFEDIDDDGNLVLLNGDGLRVKAGVVEIL